MFNPLAVLEGPLLANPDGSMSLMEHLSSSGEQVGDRGAALQGEVGQEVVAGAVEHDRARNVDRGRR